MMASAAATSASDAVAPGTPASSTTASSAAAAAAGGPVAAAVTPQKRRRAAKIDLDDRIAEATRDMKHAQKALHAARAQARNERRKKQRLVKKAAALTTADLERIAQLKKGGLWDPALGLPAPPLEDGDTEKPKVSSAAASALTGLCPATAGGPSQASDSKAVASTAAAATDVVRTDRESEVESDPEE